MNVLKNDRVVVCDCDDTVALWFGTNPPEIMEKLQTLHGVIEMGNEGFSFPIIPHKIHIDFLRQLKIQGYAVILWSKAGYKWAAKVRDKLKLNDVVDLVMTKPIIVMDDLKIHEIFPSRTYFDPVTGVKTSLKDNEEKK